MSVKMPEKLLRYSLYASLHLCVVGFQTGHWSYSFSKNVLKLQRSFKKMMQFYIYCAVPGPKQEPVKQVSYVFFQC